MLPSAPTRSAAHAVANRKVSKYASLSASHLFVPIAIETHGAINEAVHSFLSELGRLLSTISDDSRLSFFLFQRISILIQSFNEVAFTGTVDAETCHDEKPFRSVFNLKFLILGIINTEGNKRIN